jgi:hypothetical protein
MESKHEALEKMYFWPVVRDHLPDGDSPGRSRPRQTVRAMRRPGAATDPGPAAPALGRWFGPASGTTARSAKD